MAKISELTSGGAIVSTDELIAVRTGANVRVALTGLMSTQSANAVAITGGTISVTTLTATGDISTTTAGTSNFRAGVNAGNSIVSGGNYNTVVGDEAGTAITTGDNNVAVGFASLDANETGGNNTAVGYYSLGANATGTKNVCIGFGAGDAITTGSNNTIIGDYAGTTDLADTIVLASGTTVQLTVNSAGNITPTGGGIYLGGTAAANLLDDYEEGTWDPTLEGSTTAGNETYTTQIGTYEKIGRQVTARCRVTLLSLGTLAGNVSIEGLPFPSSSSASTYGSVTFGSGAQLSLTAGTGLTGYVQINDTSILVQRWSATTGTAALTDSNLTNTSQFIVSAVYMV